MERKASGKDKKPSLKPAAKIGLLETKLDEITGEQRMLEVRIREYENKSRSRGRRNWIVAGTAGFFILALLIGLIGYLWHNLAERDASAGLAAAVSAEPKYDPGYPGELSETVFLAPPSLELPPGEIAAEQGRINIYGRAPGAKRAALLVDGRERASQDLSHPEFVFQSVALGVGTNLIQVLSEDQQGNQSLSVAQMLEYPGQGPAKAAYTPGLDYTRGSRDFQGVALTFDAGGQEGYAAEVLEILRGQGVRATIFVTGQFIKDHPDLVRRMVEDGHEIGNHTYSHPHLTTWETNSRQWTAPGVTKEFLQTELANTARLFKETTSSEMAGIWRAPYGEENLELRKWAEQAGFYHIGWSRTAKLNYDTLDWLCDQNSKLYKSSDQIRSLLTGLAQKKPSNSNGAIVLMHLSTDRGQKFPAQVLLPALQAFNVNGYRIVKVSELIPGLLGK